MEKALLVIDLQRQFADKDDNNREYNKCLSYIRNNASDYSLIIATLFCQDKDNINYKQHLHWDGCSDSNSADLEFIRELEKTNTALDIVSKNGYGFTGINLDYFIASLPSSLSTPIDIIGCDADACVMAICFQLWDMGYTNISILTDYIYTTADEVYGITREVWINIMRRNFGDCVIMPKKAFI